MAKSVFQYLLIAIACVCLLGCSGDKGPKRYRISGKVTYQGKPVPVGTVMFEPDSSAGNSGAAGSAAIKDGEFDSGADGVGFIGGPHRITVQAFDGKNPDPDFNPYGSPIGGGNLYVKSFDLPVGDATLDIELADELDKGDSAKEGKAE